MTTRRRLCATLAALATTGTIAVHPASASASEPKPTRSGTEPRHRGAGPGVDGLDEARSARRWASARPPCPLRPGPPSRPWPHARRWRASTSPATSGQWPGRRSTPAASGSRTSRPPRAGPTATPTSTASTAAPTGPGWPTAPTTSPSPTSRPARRRRRSSSRTAAAGPRTAGPCRGSWTSSTTPTARACYGLSRTKMISWIRSFTTRYHRLTGRDAVIYTTLAWWRRCTGNTTAFSPHQPAVGGHGRRPRRLAAGRLAVPDLLAVLRGRRPRPRPLQRQLRQPHPVGSRMTARAWPPCLTRGAVRPAVRAVPLRRHRGRGRR